MCYTHQVIVFLAAIKTISALPMTKAVTHIVSQSCLRLSQNVVRGATAGWGGGDASCGVGSAARILEI